MGKYSTSVCLALDAQTLGQTTLKGIEKCALFKVVNAQVNDIAFFLLVEYLSTYAENFSFLSSSSSLYFPPNHPPPHLSLLLLFMFLLLPFSSPTSFVSSVSCLFLFLLLLFFSILFLYLLISLSYNLIIVLCSSSAHLSFESSFSFVRLHLLS